MKGLTLSWLLEPLGAYLIIILSRIVLIHWSSLLRLTQLPTINIIFFRTANFFNLLNNSFLFDSLALYSSFQLDQFFSFSFYLFFSLLIYFINFGFLLFFFLNHLPEVLNLLIFFLHHFDGFTSDFFLIYYNLLVHELFLFFQLGSKSTLFSCQFILF